MGTGERAGVASLGARLRGLAASQPGLTSIIVMALAGITISGYLTAVHYTHAQLACPTTGVINCEAVTSSAYSVVPGTAIPITIPGIVWFVVSGGLAGVALVRVWQGLPELPLLRLAQLLWGAAGLLFVLYLVYAEIVVLHKICVWCTVIHLLTLGTFLVALARWQDASAGRGRRTPVNQQPRGAAARGSSATARSGQSDARRRTSGRGR